MDWPTVVPIALAFVTALLSAYIGVRVAVVRVESKLIEIEKDIGELRGALETLRTKINGGTITRVEILSTEVEKLRRDVHDFRSTITVHGVQLDSLIEASKTPFRPR